MWISHGILSLSLDCLGGNSPMVEGVCGRDAESLFSFQDTLSCSSWPASPGLRWEKRWCDLRLIPLLHSRFSQYLPGTDLSR